MLFNSFEFAIFLPLVFLLYWFVFQKSIRQQNVFLLIASYVFYGWWDYRFLSLIIFSSAVDFLVGKKLERTQGKAARKLLLLSSIIVNIGFLGFFKYYNFFAESFAEAFTFMGSHFEANRLNIVLPVGISFYTFQTLSYTIDIYRKKIKPTKDPVAFFAFVSFFPQLVAGPIERASNLLPQFSKQRRFHYPSAVDGSRQILWGLFKKIVIADNCAGYVNQIFENYADYNTSTLILGAVLFAFQIYGDFSGYSDIAIGTARLFGFNLKQNFAFPYFSRDIAEFWRRWHISLSTWFRDYVYIPLGGSKVNTAKKVRNVFIIFLVSGLWHGANWTFVAWGFLNALYFLPLMLVGRNREHNDKIAGNKLLPGLFTFAKIIITFALTCFAWIFFRAESISHAFSYIGNMELSALLIPPQKSPVELFILIGLMLVAEWLQRHKKHALELDKTKVPLVTRWLVYYAIIILMIVFSGEQHEFIYFQF